MEALEPSNQLFISGKIVETLEREGKLVAGIAYPGGHVYLPLDSLPDAHLGDTVTLKATLSVQKIEQQDYVNNDSIIQLTKDVLP
jgi:hypothetical protein